MKDSNPKVQSTNRDFIATVLLILASIMAVSLSLYSLDRYPDCFDFDAAAEAAFVNNISVKGSYDYGFKDLTDWPASAHVLNAARRLAFSLPLAFLQKALGLDPFHVDSQFKIFALLMAIGAILSIFIFVKDWTQRLFILAFTLAHPAFFIYIRTGFASILSTFLFFWLALALFIKYLKSERVVYLYGFSLVLAYFALVAHPPLAAMPLILLFLWMALGCKWKVLFSPHPYLAMLLLCSVYFSTDRFIGSYIAGDYSEYKSRSDSFVKFRKKTISFKHQWQEQKFSDKVKKLVNQHVLFQRDNLGESTREDEIWTLGSLHPLFIFSALLVLIGIIRSLALRRENDRVFLAILLGFFPLFFTLSFPEGRYIMPVIPCYAYFIFVTVELFPIKPWATKTSLALIVIISVPISYFFLTGSYQSSMQDIKVCREGQDLKSIFKELVKHKYPEPVYVTLPVRWRLKLWNSFIMHTHFNFEWVDFEKAVALSETLEKGTILFVTEHPKDVRNSVSRPGIKRIKKFKGFHTNKTYSLLKVSKVEN